MCVCVCVCMCVCVSRPCHTGDCNRKINSIDIRSISKFLLRSRPIRFRYSHEKCTLKRKSHHNEAPSSVNFDFNGRHLQVMVRVW